MRALTNPAEEYLSWLAVEKGRSANTLASYRRDLAAYESSLAEGGRSALDAGPSDLDTYVSHLRDEHKSPASVARAVSAIRGFHRFLVDEGHADHDPAADLQAGPLPLRLPKALPEAEVARILDSVSGDDPRARRDRALLELLYGTGARVSEVVGLNLTDLAHLSLSSAAREPNAAFGPAPGAGPGRPDVHLLRLFGKGSKERVVPLGSEAAQALARWLEPAGRDRMVPARWGSRRDAEAVFLNTRGTRLSRQGAFAAVRARATAVGASLGPHALRHSCATHLLAHGADVRVVQELLGHASVTTTQLYTRVTNEHLRTAYEAAHPRAGRRPAP